MVWLRPWPSDKHPYSDRVWSIGLLIAAAIAFGLNLGGVALRDWDEGTVAQIAKEIWRSPADSLTWLFPTLWGEPYFNKPPLMHNLIAIAYSIGGVNEWMSRLPGAILTALSVPLLYWVGRELFQRRLTAGIAALVYLSSLPVVRLGRLAMLDGAILCFVIALMWCVLRSRRDSRFALGIGLALGLICLTKGVMVGVLFGAIALAFLLWDTPRLLTSPFLWIGIALGCAPVAFWYNAQLSRYGDEFLGRNLVNQSLSRIWSAVENHAEPPWFYALELLKYSAPWMLFWPLGFKLAWENRNLSWAKLVLVWSIGFFVTISVMVTKLPWYVLPLYPALALVTGACLTHLWDCGYHDGVSRPSIPPYSRVWVGLFALLAIAAWSGLLYFGLVNAAWDLVSVFITVGITMSVVAVLFARQNPQFVPVLLWGTYLSVVALMSSGYWVWELGESYPVKPVAAIVQAYVPEGQTVFTSNSIYRPSLSFYSDRRVVPASGDRLRKLWTNRQPPYLLLDDMALHRYNFDSQKNLARTDGWTLITRE